MGVVREMAPEYVSRSGTRREACLNNFPGTASLRETFREFQCPGFAIEKIRN